MTRKDNVEYHNGKSAHAQGIAIDANPFTLNPDPDSRFNRWELGWIDAEASKARLDARDPVVWLETVWDALPDSPSDDVATAMAWITEALGYDYNHEGDLVTLEEVQREEFEQAIINRGEPTT